MINHKAAALSPPRRRRPKEAPASTSGHRGEQYHLRAITRALDVLECFSDARSTLGMKEIAAAVGMPESSVFRILMTLEGRGYLVQEANGSYRLSRTLGHGRVLERAERIRMAVRGFLTRLAHRHDETASLAYLFGEHIQVLDTVETLQEIRVTNKPGRIIPPYCSSLGKAITAFQPQEMIDRILEAYGMFRRTAHTLVDRRALLEEFEKIRSQGYAVDREEVVIGGICLGAPVRGTDGVAAAISVSVPAVRLSREREAEITESLVSCAADVGQALRDLGLLP